MKKYKQIIILCIILLLSLNVLNIHGDNKSDIKYKDSYIQSIDLGDKICYYCIFSSNEDVKVDIHDISYKGNELSNVQNYRLGNIPKLVENEKGNYDRYNIEDNEYSFIKFKDILDNNKNIYIYFGQMPIGVKTDKFIGGEYIVKVGEPTYNDFEVNGDNLKYKYYDGSYAKGWVVIDNKQYYFDEDTNIARKGWLEDAKNSSWYYFDDNYSMIKGVYEIDGIKYYFDDTGKMLINTTAPDGTKIDANGVYLESTENEEE